MTEQNEIVQYSPMQDDLNFGNDDLTLPRWKINKVGMFVNTMTNEEKPELTAVPLRADVSRFMWPPKFAAGNLPLCYSTDGITPSIDAGYSDKCSTCPMQQWQNGDKPKCAKSYNYLLLDTETGIPSVLNLSRARTVTARALNSFFKLNGVRFTIRFYTVLEQADAGEYWQVKFVIVEQNRNWQQYAMLMLENRGLLLTGDIAIERELAADVVIDQPTIETPKRKINKETGEVIE